MSHDALARAAAAQADLIRLSLTRPVEVTCVHVGGAALQGLAWLPLWKQARDCLIEMRLGSVQQCAGLVWREVDLAADLSGQAWWTSPRLRQAAIGEIAWATVLGRYVEGVPSAEAQQHWDACNALGTTVHRRLSTPALGRRRAHRECANQIAAIRRRWEDAWWSWATTSELGDVLSVHTAPVCPALPSPDRSAGPPRHARG